MIIQNTSIHRLVRGRFIGSLFLWCVCRKRKKKCSKNTVLIYIRVQNSELLCILFYILFFESGVLYKQTQGIFFLHERVYA